MNTIMTSVRVTGLQILGLAALLLTSVSVPAYAGADCAQLQSVMGQTTERINAFRTQEATVSNDCKPIVNADGSQIQNNSWECTQWRANGSKRGDLYGEQMKSIQALHDAMVAGGCTGVPPVQ